MAELDTKRRTRAHFAVRFTAGALRVAALLALVAGGVGTYAVFYPSQIPGDGMLSLPGVFAVVVAAVIVACAVVAALILWGVADAFILLADLDDAQRFVRAQLSDLVLEARTARGPFHHEAVKLLKNDEPPALKEQPQGAALR